ncbi:integral membrane transport protein [Bordetella pertussis]|uniref:TRAP transporter small permease protein n=3 Tax=Bordetella pertussis TaxID=520 RepID=Q7VXB4_BORPE|nr:TRAP transporter small permease [Bordetella pertussis]ETH37351.1 TRAP transporter, DctQ-like membrane protein [Bordetella pertussis H918]ETH44254.1 TRAP transporter, DctQ-like membrane protein [Bordetella pertussis H939]ETH45705.1 TRAP transporter, DctQ-like membrane protein [Bordetella pertussis H921]ETH69416.1 TRAP transporter, DctQ-like membrane protein [Bordetella pertussis STO1-CHLA-0011]ETH82274.1 TRAP transporter, DctQ-like membrane protein [Bordetella pertussis STO1-CHOC-0017]ETH85
MRRFLDRLYGAAGLLAGLCTIGVLVSVLAAIIARQVGLNIPGTDAYAGYFMAAAGFLALASTLKHGEHIRVTLLLNALPAPGHRRLDIFALCVGAILAAAFAWFSVKLAHDSWLFNDISTANDATPLWLPQLTMAAGTILFFIALLDELVRRVRGQGFAKSQQIHE